MVSGRAPFPERIAFASGDTAIPWVKSEIFRRAVAVSIESLGTAWLCEGVEIAANALSAWRWPHFSQRQRGLRREIALRLGFPRGRGPLPPRKSSFEVQSHNSKSNWQFAWFSSRSLLRDC